MWWLPVASMFVLGLVFYVTSALHVLSFSPLLVGRQAAEREAQAQAQAQAKATSNTSEARASAGNTIATTTIRLRAGQGPGAVQVSIPVPPDAQVADTTIRGERVTVRPDRAILTTSGEVVIVLAFYRATLAEHGWHEVRTWMSRPAEGASGPGGAVSVYCRAADAPALHLSVVSYAPGQSELRLLLDADSPGACASSSSPDQPEDPPVPVF